MKLKIEMNLRNSAFDGEKRDFEIARLLHRIARDFEGGNDVGYRFLDSEDVVAGTVKFEKEASDA